MQRVMLVALSLVPSLARAQSDRTSGRHDPTTALDSRGHVRVIAAPAPLRIDGRLHAAVWAAADSITDFRQRDPAEGEQASERTVVKVVRDAEALYVAVHCSDDPARLRATQLRRDADLTVDDYVTLLIDSYADRRGGFLFRTNPNGAMWDAQIAGLDDANENWNGIWEVATSRDSAGWTAEFRIPFRTLRFRAGDTVSFGFNVQRFIRRRNEEDLWRSWRRTEGLLHLSNEGELVGLGALRRAHSLELYPYALGRALESEHDSTGARTAPARADGKAGLDAKLAVTPTLTADVTANTDFAQVEVDQQVINLTRFPIFFPEKREFFLESSGIFGFGTPGRAQLFYSRRIGLDTSGAPVPIAAGARLHGKAGPWTIGLLGSRTGDPEDATDVVVRVKHDLFQRSYLGAMALQRSSSGVTGSERAGGLDALFPFVVGGQNLWPQFWLAGTHTPTAAGTPLAWRAAVDFPNDLFDTFVSLYRIDTGFAPPLGFVRRTGIWETTGHVDFMPRPATFGIRQFDFEFPIPSWDIIANETGSLPSSADWQTASFEWRLFGGNRQNGDRFEVNVQRLMDAPADSFALFPGVVVQPGRYWWSRYELQYFMSQGRRVSLGALVNWGQFYGGHSTDLELTAVWQGSGHLVMSTDLTRTAARLPVGAFTAVLSASRVEYDFNTRTGVLAFVQFDNESERVDFNLRFHWIPVIGDDVFVVWTSGYTTHPLARFRFPDTHALSRPLSGALVIKAVHRLTP